MARPLVLALVLLVLFSGCLDLFGADKGPASYESLGWKGEDAAGTDGLAWPDIRDGELTVLVTGDAPAFDKLATRFEELTGVTVVREDEQDPIQAVEDLGKGEAPPADVVLGLDNMLLFYAAEQDVLDPYEPLLGGRIQEPLLFLGDRPAYGTPFEHVYYAVHWNPDHPQTNTTQEDGFVQSIFQVRERSDLFLVTDPRSGDPAGQAFLWMTVGAFGDDRSAYDWRDFWRELLVPPTQPTEGGPKRGLASLAPSLESAIDGYVDSFETDASRPVAWLPTTYEAANATAEDRDDVRGRVLLQDGTTWHRINTAAVVKGTQNLAAAQAWVEFLLTDHVQGMLAEEHGTYPVVEGVDSTGTFGGLEPTPGSFRPAFVDPLHAGVRVADWLDGFARLAADAGA